MWWIHLGQQIICDAWTTKVAFQRSDADPDSIISCTGSLYQQFRSLWQVIGWVGKEMSDPWEGKRTLTIPSSGTKLIASWWLTLNSFLSIPWNGSEKVILTKHNSTHKVYIYHLKLGPLVFKHPIFW